MGIFSSVNCSEVHGSARENLGLESGVACTVQLMCAWDDRHALARDILGNRKPWPYGSYTNPPKAESCAISPMLSSYIATDDQQGIAQYASAYVTVNYSSKVKDLISETLEPVAQFLQEDWKRFRWTSEEGDPILENEAPGKLFRSLNLVRTIYDVALPLPGIMLTAIGQCNTASYTSSLLGLTFPAQTLLYQPPNIQRKIKTNGDEASNVTLKFTFKPQGWNKYWRAKTQTSEYLYDVEAGSPYLSYEPGDFSALLF